MASGFFTTSATWEAPHLMVSRLEKGMAIYSAAAKSFQSCLTLCKPIDSSPPGSPVPGFSRQEHWSGLPFPSPMHESESEVAQSCPTLCDPMDCSLPGSTVHGIAKSQIQPSDFTFTFMHWRRKWQRTPLFLPGESQGQGSLVGCCLCGRTELDMTEVT